MRSCEHLLVGRQREIELDEALAIMLGMIEVVKQGIDVGFVEIVAGLFDLVLVIDVAIGDAAERPVGPDDIENTLDVLQIHRQALEAVGDLSRYRAAFQATDLLEVSELRHLHAVQPDFPAESPGAQRWRLPVVFDEANIVYQGVDADGLERLEVQILEIVRRGLDGHLVLVVVL